MTQMDVLVAQMGQIQKQLKSIEVENKPNKKRVLSVLEVCKMYNIGYRRIKAAIASGELAYLKLNGRDVSVYQGDVDNWLDSLRRRDTVQFKRVETYDSNVTLLKASSYLELPKKDKRKGVN